MTTPVRTRLRVFFRNAATAATFAMASTAGIASANTAPAATAYHHVSHRDQGACPVPGSTEQRDTPPYDFAASPREQQRLLENIGFVIGRPQPDGIFRERTLQSVNEFRQLYYGPAQGVMPFVQSLNPQELADLRAFAERVQAERRQHGLTLEAATALRFAARATDAVHAELVRETAKGKSGFSGSMADFLYLVKENATKYNLGYFAGRITSTRADNGVTTVRIDDPATFLLAEGLRKHPRIALLMEAERIKLGESMPATDYQRGTAPASIPLNRLQADLLTLGFGIGGIDNDFGPRTEAAYRLYRTLYAPLIQSGEDVDSYMPRFADLAQRDARTYGIPAPAAAAIRLASLRTGVDFGYMMELSSAESGFDHEISAATSSATGLFQFTEDTWLQSLRRYGAWYGMAPLSEQMNNTFDMNGVLVGRVENPFIRTAAFDLRVQPHLMAMMAGEFQLRNQFRISCVIPRQLNRTEMYFGHFLGASGAITFLQNRARTPAAQAARAFPRQAEANRNVFYSRNKKGQRIARSYNDVYAFFNRKFGREIYEDSANLTAMDLHLHTPQQAHTIATPEGYGNAAVSREDTAAAQQPPAPVPPRPGS